MPALFLLKENSTIMQLQNNTVRLHEVYYNYWILEYIRKHAVRLLRLREQHTPPRSVIVIVISL